MRRIVLAGSAALVIALVAAAAAYAAINTYTANVSFTSKAAGTPAKPATVGFTLNLSAKGTNGNRTAVLHNLTTKIYGIKADGKDFPTCSVSQISAAHTDTGCPKAAEVATGYITATLGSSTNFQAAGAACDPLLDVWNGGPGKLVFFFVDTPTHQCLGTVEKTGDVGPYPGSVSTKGKYLVVSVPVPPYVNSPVPGLSGSLETEHLVWKKATAKVKGKTVALFSSIGCQGKKRPYSQSFTATLPTTNQTATNTVTGSAACS